MSLNASSNSTSPPEVFYPNLSLFTVPITIGLLTVLVCLLGLVGNVITIYLLSFRIKLNQSTVYILNLAVADFIYVFGYCMVSIYLLCMHNFVPSSNETDRIFGKFGDFLHSFGFNSSLFFLATLCIERSLSVRFPIWYKCRRPEHLSAILCGVIWIVSVLITVLERYLNPEYISTVYIVISVVFLVVTLVMIGASVVLIIEIQKTSIQLRPMKIYIVVVTAVITFLISLVPATIVRLLLVFDFILPRRMRVLSYILTSLCSAINCTVNPYIYIIVGKWKKSVSTTQALESVFKEEDERSSEGGNSVETQQTDIEQKPSTLRRNGGDEPRDS